MPSEKTPRRLGRGLDALFNAIPSPTEGPPTALKEISVDRIRSNPFQPRKDFNPEELRELRESLKTSGLLQPIIVRHLPDGGDDYELIAGERRLRAATELGWTTISAIVRDLDDQELLGHALIENLQRSDLNPIEEAEGYDRLIAEFGYTQQTVATMVGRHRSTIANMLRVLQLPPPIRQMLREGQLAIGHARPLLGLNDEARMINLAREIFDKGLSARDIERRVREVAPMTEGRKRGRPLKKDSRPIQLRILEDELRRHFQTDVSISWTSKEHGIIKISFYSAEDLERITDLLGLTPNPQ